MAKRKNISNRKFGKLTAKYVDEEKTKIAKKTYWICECECGNIVSVSYANLTSGSSKSCGCYRRESRFEDLTGKQYGELTVISRGEDTTRKNSNGNDCFMRTWNCICSCGKYLNNVNEHTLKQNHIKSCGHIINNKDPRYYPKKETMKNRYDLSGEYGIGYSHKNIPFYFDLEDYNLIQNIYWNVKRDMYVEGINNGKYVSLHRIIMGEPDCYVDHINHHPEDNRKINLRLANPTKNQSNRKININNKSGVKGVYQTKDLFWMAELTYNKITHRKKFETFCEAVEYRQYLERVYQKSFSYNESMKNGDFI